MIPDDSTFHTFNISQSGTFCTYIDTNGKLYLSGIGVKGLSPGGVGKKDGQKQHLEIPSLTTTQLPKLASCHCGWSAPLVALVSEEGGVFMFGEPLFDGMPKEEDDRIRCEMDGVKFQSISLGEKHALIVSREGLLYSFGHNNKGECGVAEVEQEGEQDKNDDKVNVLTPLFVYSYFTQSFLANHRQDFNRSQASRLCPDGTGGGAPLGGSVSHR